MTEDIAASVEAEVPSGHRSLSALWTDVPGGAAVAVVAHGANNDMRHAFFRGVAGGLASGGVSVLRFDFPYKQAGRSYPDRPPVLLQAWEDALAEAARRAGGRPVVASGKSLGGRMASMLAAERPGSFAASGLVFFGYPLHAPGKSDRPRDTHLADVSVPMLFIQGTQDPLARLDLVEGLVARLGPRARLHRVEGGDHSLRVRGARQPDEIIGLELGGVAAAWIREITGG